MASGALTSSLALFIGCKDFAAMQRCARVYYGQGACPWIFQIPKSSFVLFALLFLRVWCRGESPFSTMTCKASFPCRDGTPRTESPLLSFSPLTPRSADLL